MPFHDEKSPSFHITPARGMFFCFGCHEGGDVISFVQKIDQLSFTEAVERLADKVGLHLRYEEAGPVAHRRRTANSAPASSRHTVRLRLYYAGHLAESPEAVPGRRFLDERGFDRDAADRFGVGYARVPATSCASTCASKASPTRSLVSSGLVAQGRGAPYDRFRAGWSGRSTTCSATSSGSAPVASTTTTGSRPST